MSSVEKFIGESQLKSTPTKKFTFIIDDEKVTTAKIADNAITEKKISGEDTPEGAAVTTSKIKDGAVTNPKIANGAVTTIKIQDFDAESSFPTGVTNEKLADASVTESKLASGAVTERKIAPNAVTAGKIADDAVIAGNIAAGAITHDNLTEECVQAGNIANGAVQSGNLAPNAVQEGNIAAGAIHTEDIHDGAVTSAKIEDYDPNSATPTGVTTAKIANYNVTEAKLADGAVTTAKLADGMIEQLQTITDAVPTAGSVKPVQSDAVALHGSALDVSELNKSGSTLATYTTLSNALAAVPATYKKAGMSIKYLQLTPAYYSVVKTEGLETEPTGTEVQEALSVNSGIYTADQLDGITLPASVNASLTYYLAVTEDETTTYITWVVKYVSAETRKYVQYRLTTTDWNTNVSNWQGVDSEPTTGSNNLVESGGVEKTKVTVSTGKNLLNPQTCLAGVAINKTNGALLTGSSYASFYATDFIPVSEDGISCNNAFKVFGTYAGAAIYWSNKTFKRMAYKNNTYQDGDAYIRFTLSTLTNAQVEKGTVSTSYYPYSPIAGHPLENIGKNSLSTELQGEITNSIRKTPQELTNDEKNIALTNLGKGESVDLRVDGIHRVFEVTAGTAMSSAMTSTTLKAGCYYLLWKNVTTENDGTGKLYGADFYNPTIKIGVPTAIVLNSECTIYLGDTGRAMLTSGTMEFVIKKIPDNIDFKADNALCGKANKAGGKLFGDFVCGNSPSSIYMAQKRVHNETLITFEETVKIVASTGYRFFYHVIDGETDTYYDWTTSTVISSGKSVWFCIEDTTHDASWAMDIDKSIGALSIQSVEDDASDVFVKELSITPAKGGIDPDGTNNSLGQRIRGKITYADKDYIVYTDPGYWFCLAFYGSSTVNSFLNYDNDGHAEYRSFIHQGSYFNIFIGRNYVQLDISEWKHLHIIPATSKDVWDDENYDIVKRNKEAVNNILAAQKQFDFSNAGDSSRKFTVAHITDIHDDRIRMKNFNDFVSNFDSYITTCILTGDFVTLPIEAHYDYIMDVVDANTKLLKVVGNHEKSQNDTETGSPTYGQTFYNTRAEMYANLRMNTDTGKLYYYEDFNSKYRIIVLNQYDTDDDIWGTRDYSQEQIDWFIATLKDAATNNLHVIVAKHQLETTPTPNDNGFYQRRVYGTPWDGVSEIVTPIEDIIHAFMTAGTINKTYANAHSGSITVDTTFDTAGVFVAHLVGHVHQDQIGYSSQYDDQLYLCLCNAGLSSGNSYAKVTDKASDLARIPGCKSEDCFNVYVFDPSARYIKIIRVGSDTNDILEDRKVAVFEY